MRPTSRPQSAIQFPLDYILSTAANVRVLRVVTLSDVPISVSELARKAALQPSGVARVCTRLEDLGVLESVGRGARQYRRSPRFAFSKSLGTLFMEERNRGEQIFQEIRSAVAASGVRSGWIEGRAAAGTDRPGDSVIVGVLVDPGAVESVRMGLWQRLLDVQTRRDITIELRVLTLADLKTASPEQQTTWDHIRLLQGAPPMEIVRGEQSPRSSERPAKTSRVSENRALEIARFIADRLRRDPSLVEDARRYIERRYLTASPGERLELAEWRSLLDTMSISRLRRFLIDPGPRATRLRQSLPFITAVSETDRLRLFKKRKSGH